VTSTIRKEQTRRQQDQQDCAFLNVIAATYIRFGQHQKAYDVLMLAYSADSENEETLCLLAMVSIRVGQPSVTIAIITMLENLIGNLSDFHRTLKDRATRNT